MKKKNIHVTKRKDGWATISEGSDRAVGLFKTQSEAINVARPIAQNNNLELVIHNRKNRIRDKDSYGNDPMSPKDKKF